MNSPKSGSSISINQEESDAAVTQTQVCCNAASCQCLKSLEQFNKSRCGFFGCNHNECENHDISESLQYINTTLFESVKQVADFYRINIPDEKQDFNNAARYIAGRDVIPKLIKFRLWDAVALRNFVHHFASNQAHINQSLGQYNLCIQWFNGVIKRISSALNTPEVKPKRSGSSRIYPAQDQMYSNHYIHPQMQGIPYMFNPAFPPQFVRYQPTQQQQQYLPPQPQQQPKPLVINKQTKPLKQQPTAQQQQTHHKKQRASNVEAPAVQDPKDTEEQDVSTLYKQLQHKYNSDVGRLTQDRKKIQSELQSKINDLETKLKQSDDKYTEMYEQLSFALQDYGKVKEADKLKDQYVQEAYSKIADLQDQLNAANQTVAKWKALIQQA